MRDFFLNIDYFCIYRWEDYFNTPPTEEGLRTLVQARMYNTRVGTRSHVHRATLPVLRGVGCIFLLKNEMKISTRDQKPEKAICLHEGDFCKIPYGDYIYEYSDNCECIVMVLYEEFPEYMREKLGDYYGEKI